MNTNTNSVEDDFVALIGLDWGDRQHAVALFDCAAGKNETLLVEHTAEKLRVWIDALEQRFGGRQIAVALETSKGPLVNAFLNVPWLTVFPIHPATSTRMRKAFAPSGAKDDVPDAEVLLDLLRYHRSKLRPMSPEDPLTRRLAALCEVRRKSVDHRTDISNELRAVLKSYYPQALELVGRNLHSPIALEFLKRWPDLITLKTSRPSTVKAFYYRHNVRRPKALETRLEQIANAVALTTDDATVVVASRQVARLVEMLERLQRHIVDDDKQIAKAFAEHPEAELFRDLPGAGPNLGPRLLVAFGTDRTRYASASEMHRYSGIAPVKEKSCGRIWIHWRWNAPLFLRQSFIEWTGQTVRYCNWARAYYDQQRAKGKRHWAVLRALAFKWIRILWKCWKTRTPYNETIYLESLRKCGSVLLKIC